MKVKIEQGVLTLEIEVEEPKLSASGKNIVIASTRGIVITDCIVDKKPVKIGFNAFVAKG